MNTAHFHLIVNHLPIIFPIVGIIVLLTGLIFKSDAVKRTAFFVFIIGAVATLMAMSSGEGAEEIVEHLPGVDHDYIEEHEESAELFAIVSYTLGLLSLVALWANWKKKSFANYLSFGVLITSFVAVYTGSKTGTTGGEIRHTEIRANFDSSSMDHDHDDHD